MAAVQHEPVAEKVVQFLPAPPPPPPPPPSSLLPPSSQSSSLTLPLGLFTVDMVGVFFSSSFLPFSNRLTKALPFRRVFSLSLCCLLTLSLTNTLTLSLSNSLFLLLFLEPCVPPSPPSLLVCLPSSSPVSSSPQAVRECWSRSSPPPLAGRAQEERMGALSLSLTLTLVCLFTR